MTVALPHAPGENIQLPGPSALEIPDMPPQERFDRVTRIARRLFNTKIASINLVDDNKLWFKSCQGLEVREIDRETSLCAQAAMGSGVMVVTDTTQDPRFAQNPVVTGAPFIRFFAGCPLTLLNGNIMGTLCISDDKPRSFSEEDAQALQDLTRMFEAELAAFQIATTDPVTGLSNRPGFRGLARHRLDACARDGKPATLAFLDLDSFKLVNDTYGHSEGDRALAHFAHALQHSIRETDISARIGGDEFVALLPDGTPLDAQAALERLASRLQSEEKRLGLPYSIAFSSGLATFQPGESPDLDRLLNMADRSMFAAKSAAAATLKTSGPDLTQGQLNQGHCNA